MLISRFLFFFFIIIFFYAVPQQVSRRRREISIWQAKIFWIRRLFHYGKKVQIISGRSMKDGLPHPQFASYSTRMGIYSIWCLHCYTGRRLYAAALVSWVTYSLLLVPPTCHSLLHTRRTSLNFLWSRIGKSATFGSLALLINDVTFRFH